jgi:hypothetical protein
MVKALSGVALSPRLLCQYIQRYKQEKGEKETEAGLAKTSIELHVKEEEELQEPVSGEAPPKEKEELRIIWKAMKSISIED